MPKNRVFGRSVGGVMHICKGMMSVRQYLWIMQMLNMIIEISNMDML